MDLWLTSSVAGDWSPLEILWSAQAGICLLLSVWLAWQFAVDWWANGQPAREEKREQTKAEQEVSTVLIDKIITESSRAWVAVVLLAVGVITGNRPQGATPEARTAAFGFGLFLFSAGFVLFLASLYNLRTRYTMDRLAERNGGGH